MVEYHACHYVTSPHPLGMLLSILNQSLSFIATVTEKDRHYYETWQFVVA